MLRVGLIQMAVGSCKKTNLQNAVKLIKQASDQGAKLITLPECFNSPYGTQYFGEYAENIPGNSSSTIADAAKANNVHVIAGSIPEREGDKLFNTCCIFDNKGEMIDSHRKVHLFDIDIPGKITFKESEVLTAGNKGTVFELENGVKIGVGICYDIRFPELAWKYRQEGAKVLVYPGAFNMTTGPAHWAKLQTARALDNQCFVMTASPARDLEATYHAWGHSMAVNSWGEVLCEADAAEEVLVVDLDLNSLEETRKNVPISTQRMPECY